MQFRRRQWLYRFLAMTLVPAICLLLLESLLWLFGCGYPAAFFLTADRDGQAILIDNRDFGRRFFPPGLTRALEPMVLPAAKAPQTYRIFILGESAAMGFPDASYSFGRILKTMLAGRYPGTRFEIVNTAFSAINSHVILPIARDCAAHDPDLFIVYMGNNEVVGPYGASGVLGPFTPNLSLIRASVAAKGTRTGQVLSRLTRRLAASGPRRTWEGMAMFADSQVSAVDPRLQAVYAHFATNLQDICTVGAGAGGKVLVCTVACNLKDSAPFASMPASGLSQAQANSWLKYYQEGASLDDKGKHDAALSCYRRALDIDDKPADLHFRLARCLESLHRHDEARGHWVRARDLDALRFRADSRINDIIREVARGRESDGIHLVDVEEAFAAACPDRCPGEEQFYDHVHPTFEGNYLLANTVMGTLVNALPAWARSGELAGPWASLGDCREILPFTEWNRYKAWNSMAELARQPPFTQQLDDGARRERWARRLSEMKDRLENRGAIEDAVATYERAVLRGPADNMLHKDFGLLLWARGRLREAEQQLRSAVDLVPHDPLAFSWLAEVLGFQKKMAEAFACCQESIRLAPDNPQLRNVLGHLHLAAGEADKAEAAFAQALELNPASADFHTNHGLALARLKRTDAAMAEYEEALRLDPHFLHALHLLAQLLTSAGRLEPARERYDAALRLHPKDPQLHLELASVLSQQGKLDLAVGHVEQSLQLRPNWPEALQALQDLRRRQKTPPAIHR